MPTLDPPVLDRGDDNGPALQSRWQRWHPAPVAAAAFLIATVMTVLVVLLVRAVGN